MFIAIRFEKTHRKDLLLSLSSVLMRWDEEIWLLDLRPFSSYWKSRAQSLRTPLLSLLRKVIHQALLPHTEQDILELKPPFQAAYAAHPWNAVLLLLSLRERRLNGLISDEQDFARTLLRNLSWPVWWEALGQLQKHLPNKDQKTFAQACKRMQAAVGRLAFKNAQELQILNYASLRRRFGSWIAELWTWTFASVSEKSLLTKESFPWKSFSFSSPMEITRHLEFSIHLWEQIEVFLREDLDKVCESPLWGADERVTELCWKLTFDDLSILPVPILFRNPHDLRSQKGEHRTTLLQAQFAFQKLAEKLHAGDPPYPTILSWRLTLSGKLLLPTWARDLFGESLSGSDEALFQMENELSLPLQRFADREDWLPEDSFALQDTFLPNEEEHSSFRMVALNRPLFLYKEKPKCPSQAKGIFLEKTMAKWWNEKGSHPWERQYYKYFDEKGRALWIYKDSSGKWVTHGNFG